MAATFCLDELESLPPAMYSYAWNHDPTYCDKLRSLKRRLTELQLHHLHDLSARWIRAFAVSITDSTIIKRFLPWDPRGFVRVPSEYGGPPASIEADALWREFTSGLTAISDKFEQEIDPREQLSPKQTEAFVEAAMIFVEPYFAEQEAWEDAHMMKLLPKVLARHFWTGKVGEAPGGSEKKAASGTPAPAPAAPGPWWGAFRYTIDASGMRADVHIHNHLAPESPFSDTARLFRWFVEMSEHIRKFEPQVTHIGTGTWLNNHLAYASVFPPAYRETLVRGEGTRKGLSSWGQYITSDLKLNESRAAMLIAEQRFALHEKRSAVPFADFEQHVRAQLAKAEHTPPKL